MDFKSIAIYTTKDGIEPVTGILYTLGINGVEIIDNENPLNKDIESNISIVKAYVGENEQGGELIGQIERSISKLRESDSEHNFGSLKVEISKTRDEDWANNWKKYYKPLRVGSRIVIVPEWESYGAAEGDVIVKINPGAAFGTGTHESTQLCLEFVEEFVTENTNLLDIGTGSGILAISALKLGAKTAVGIDIDELAVDAAAENARLNGVEKSFEVRCGNLADGVEGRYSLITANIIADVIIQLALDVPGHLSEGGVFVASGIIDTREDEVRKALEQNGLCVFDSKSRKNWVALACRKK